jgi:thermitase
MRRPTFFLTAALLSVAVVAPSASADPPAAGTDPGARAAIAPDGEYSARRLLVGFAPGVGAERRRALIGSVGARREAVVGAGTHVLVLPDGGVEAAAAALLARRGVRYAEPDYVLRSSATPNDPSFGAQWWLLNSGQAINGVTGVAGADINARAAWDRSRGDGAKVVAVLDTGVDYNHPDLAPNMWSNPGVGGCPPGSHGWNVLSAAAPCDPMDDDTITPAHGTRIAGLIAAATNNRAGIAGVSWRTPIMAVKWTNNRAFGTNSQLLAAIDKVVAARAAGVDVRVINVSGTFVGTARSEALNQGIIRAGESGILFVTAAGNTSQNNDDPATPRYPCDYAAPNELCVAATDQNDQLADFSNFGPATVDLAAPGVNMYSTQLAGTYGFDDGTSYAAPLVAAAAALALSVQDMPVTLIRQRLLASVTRLPSLAGKIKTGGRLDLCKAVPGCVPVGVEVSRRLRLSGALRRGIAVRVRTRDPGRVGARLSVSRASARRLGLSRRLRVVARDDARLQQPGTARLRLRIRRAARSHLAGARAVRVTVRIQVVDDVGTPSTVRRRVTLRG